MSCKKSRGFGRRSFGLMAMATAPKVKDDEDRAQAG